MSVLALASVPSASAGGLDPSSLEGVADDLAASLPESPLPSPPGTPVAIPVSAPAGGHVEVASTALAGATLSETVATRVNPVTGAAASSAATTAQGVGGALAPTAQPATSATATGLRNLGGACRETEDDAQGAIIGARQALRTNAAQDVCRVLPRGSDARATSRAADGGLPAAFVASPSVAAATTPEAPPPPGSVPGAQEPGARAAADQVQEWPPTSLRRETGAGSSPPPALWVAGLVVAAAAVALYRRLARGRLWNAPNRVAIYESLKARPGATMGGLARGLGVDYATARHHLRILREFDLVEARRFGARLRYFPNGGAYAPAEQDRLAILSLPKAAAVLEALRRDPNISFAGLARATGLPRSTARWHAKRLHAHGLLPPSSARQNG